MCVHQGKLGPISTRVHKAEQYFNPTGTDCSVNSCPELLKKGKGGYLLWNKDLESPVNKFQSHDVFVRSRAAVPLGARHAHHSCDRHTEAQPV